MPIFSQTWFGGECGNFANIFKDLSTHRGLLSHSFNPINYGTSNNNSSLNMTSITYVSLYATAAPELLCVWNWIWNGYTHVHQLNREAKHTNLSSRIQRTTNIKLLINWGPITILSRLPAITAWHPRLPSLPAIPVCQHCLPSPAAITACHPRLPSLTAPRLPSLPAIPACHYCLPSPPAITACHPRLPSPPVITACHPRLPSLPAIPACHLFTQLVVQNL